MPEGHVVAFLCSERGDDDVRGRADDGSVTAIAGTDGERPPHVIRMGESQKLLHLVDQGDHGCRERDIVNEGGGQTGEPQNGEGQRMGIAAYGRNACLRKRTDNARRFQTADYDEEADEEEEGIPVDITEYFMGIHAADQDGDYAACQCDGGGLDADHVMDDESENGQDEDDDGFFQYGEIRDHGSDIDLIQFIRTHFRFRKLFSVDDFQIDDAGCHVEQCDRAGVHGEIIEGQMGGGADHDVWRIADHRAGAADIGEKDFSDQGRDRCDMDTAAEGNRHGGDQEDSGDGVHEGSTETGDES